LTFAPGRHRVTAPRGAASLIGLGVAATCNPGGAGKWLDDHSATLAGADVIIIPDNDEAGEKHLDKTARSLAEAGAKVRLLRLSAHDSFDWIAAGGTVQQLEHLAENAPNYAEQPQQTDGLIIRCAADVEPESIDWAWEGRIARGKLSVIGGDPEEGKSQIGVYIASTISRGGDWPNNEGKAPLGSVMILSAEDGIEDTLVPRLIAAGADLTKIQIVEAVKGEDDKGRRTFNLQTDLQKLEASIKRIGDVLAIIIDPASAYMGKGVDSHNDQAVRTVLAPVAEMANRLDMAIISIMHFNKGNSQAGTKVMHRFMASVAFVAAARVAFAAVRDPDDDKRHLFLHAKNNLSPPAPGLAYRIEQDLVTPALIKTSHIVWEAGSVDITAAQAMAASQSKDVAPALEEAKQFLAGMGDGKLVKDIEKEAKEACLSWATVKRAKDALKIRSERDGYGSAGAWMWKMPMSTYAGRAP
jgi:putative DNA primase/helicase